MFPVMSFWTATKAVEPSRSVSRSQLGYFNWREGGRGEGGGGMDAIPNNATTDSAASRNSVSAISSLTTGTSLNERFAVSK